MTTNEPAVEQDTFGWQLGMRVMQSELYRHLDDTERAICDELIARNPYTANRRSSPISGTAQIADAEDLAWAVVQAACETEPADEDDPECIRILRLDLKAAVLAALMRCDISDAASTWQPQEIRNAALEEAAKVCDALSKLYERDDVGFDKGYTMAAERAAKEIRSFKSTPTAPQDTPAQGEVAELLRTERDAAIAAAQKETK